MSRPEPSGMYRLSTMQAGVLARASSSTEAPSANRVTRKPAAISRVASASRALGSSSTTKISGLRASADAMSARSVASERRRIAAVERAVGHAGRGVFARAAQALGAGVSEDVDADRGRQVAGPLLVDLADHGGERALMMPRDGLEAVPELVFEADARLAAGDHDGSLGDGRIHGSPFPMRSRVVSGLARKV